MKIFKKEDFAEANVFGTGAENTGYAQYFQGDSFLNPLTDPKTCPVFLANVTFEPGCRNNWHLHHASAGGGQILICTAGEGWYQEDVYKRQHKCRPAGDQTLLRIRYNGSVIKRRRAF